MHAIEFEATAHQHTIRLPDNIPEGTRLRVLLLSKAPFDKSLDPLNVAVRIEELAELKDGWLDGKGHAPERSLLNWLARSFGTNFDSNLPLPYLYPTAEGGVQAEWSIDNWEVTLDIDLNKQTAEFQALHLSTQACTECVLDLSKQSAWQQLNESLKQLITVVA